MFTDEEPTLKGGKEKQVCGEKCKEDTQRGRVVLVPNFQCLVPISHEIQFYLLFLETVTTSNKLPYLNVPIINS